jgi:hypothetical protein
MDIKKVRSRLLLILLPGPLSDKFAGAIGKGPLGHGIAPLTGTGYDGIGKGPLGHGIAPLKGPGYDGVGPVAGGFIPGPAEFGAHGPFLDGAPILAKRGNKV